MRKYTIKKKLHVTNINTKSPFNWYPNQIQKVTMLINKSNKKIIDVLICGS